MKQLLLNTAVFFFAIQCVQSTTHAIKSGDDLEELIESGKLLPGDVIEWENGEYSDQELNISGVNGEEAKPITMCAAKPGGVILRGESQFYIGANWWVIEGFHFDGGDGKFNNYNPIQFRGSNGVGAQHTKLTSCAITNLVAEDESSKWVLMYGKNNTIESCHFSGKNSKGALITVELGYLKDGESAGHRIASNYFANFSLKEGSDNETIRVGFSGDQNKAAKCLIEGNYFYRCDGENEIISNKSSFNTYRANIFRQCNGALVLRHGHHARVEGNFFFGDGAENAGGIRVTDSHHIIVNNYMEGLNGKTWNAAFSILGGKQASGGKDNGYQVVEGITVAHNSIINCERSIFLNKAKGKRAPTGLIANNLVSSSSGPLVLAELSSEMMLWEGNLFHGAEVGIIAPGITADPGLVRSGKRMLPGPNGGAADTAVKIKFAVERDIVGQTRSETGKDIGADEVSGATGEVSIAPLEPNDVGVKFLAQEGY